MITVSKYYSKLIINLKIKNVDEIWKVTYKKTTESNSRFELKGTFRT